MTMNEKDQSLLESMAQEVSQIRLNGNWLANLVIENNKELTKKFELLAAHSMENLKLMDVLQKNLIENSTLVKKDIYHGSELDHKNTIETLTKLISLSSDHIIKVADLNYQLLAVQLQALLDR